MEEVDEILFENATIASNLMLKGNNLYSITRDLQQQYKFNITDLNNLATLDLDLTELSNTSVIESSVMADVDSDAVDELIITTADTLLFMFEVDGTLNPGFPVKLPLIYTSVPSIGDVNGNGYLDIPSNRKYNIHAIMKKNPDGSMNVEGISTDPELVKSILDLKADQITSVAGLYFGDYTDYLMEK